MMSLWMVMAGLAFGQALPDDDAPARQPGPWIEDAEETPPADGEGESEADPEGEDAPESEAEPEQDLEAEGEGQTKPEGEGQIDPEAETDREGEGEGQTEGEDEGQTEGEREIDLEAEGEGALDEDQPSDGESQSEDESQTEGTPQPDGSLELPDLEARKAANIAGAPPQSEVEEQERSETDPAETDEDTDASQTDEQAQTDEESEADEQTDAQVAEGETPVDGAAAEGPPPEGKAEPGQREKSTTPIIGPQLPDKLPEEAEPEEAPPADSSIHTTWSRWAHAIEDQLDLVRGFGPSMLLLLAGLFLLFVAHSVRGLMGKLARHGVLPRVLDLTKGLIRFVALGAIAAAIIAVTPRVLLPLIPVFASALVITAGASLTLIIPDLIAGFTLLMEGHIRPGTYLRNDNVEGVVDWVGIRTTLVIDDDGHEVQIPNRLLVREASTKDNDEWPQHTVNVHIESPLSSAQQRELLSELAKLVPWRAPGALPEVVRTDEDPKTWRVTNRLVDHRFATQHEEALLEMVEEQFGRIA